MARPAGGALQSYRRKRDFAVTAEPSGRPRRRRRTLRFVVQRHDARALHYDFRLEWAGVLKSWAVPKGPSLNPAEKRLAVQVEDHPLEYASFAGTIPAGQYGAGQVAIWDSGTWLPKGNVASGLADGRIDFTLRGRRLHGDWTMVRLRKPARKTEWLLIKKDDRYATRSNAPLTDLVTDATTQPPTKSRTTPQTNPRTKPPTKLRTTPVRGNGTVKPQLATEVTEVPQAGRWISELKLDGYRLLVHADRDAVRCYSRNGLDWTHRFRRIADVLRSLALADTWLDGEVVAGDDEGRADFARLQQKLQEADEDGLVLYVFDILVASGIDLRLRPLTERKRILQQTLAGANSSSVSVLDYVDGYDPALVATACAGGIEGLIVKDADAPYRAGRNRAWLKVKCRQADEFVIGGYTRRAGGRAGLTALLLGRYRGGRLEFAGRAGTGFDAASLRKLAVRLRSLARPTSPFEPVPSLRGGERPHWVEPRLVAQVRFAGITRAGLLRQPIFLALREDLEPRQVRLPRASAATPKTHPRMAGVRGKAVTRRKADARGKVVAPAQAVTHPSRVVYPDDGVTKGQLAAYYDAIAVALWPHLEDRPLSVLRSAGQGKRFFQRHLDGEDGPGFAKIEPPSDSSADEAFFAATDPAAIHGLAQMAAVELHTWGSRLPRVERADRLTFDIDPDATLDWATVRSAALLLRDFLATLGLASQVKTSGGLGLHVVVPMKGRLPGFETTAQFTRSVAQHLAHTIPELFTARRGAANRRGRMYIDWQRNQRGATTVAAYSPRARPGVPVSMPLAWSELGSQDLRGSHFNLRNAVARVHGKGDPWLREPCKPQALGAKVLRKLERIAR